MARARQQRTHLHRDALVDARAEVGAEPAEVLLVADHRGIRGLDHGCAPAWPFVPHVTDSYRDVHVAVGDVLRAEEFQFRQHDLGPDRHDACHVIAVGQILGPLAGRNRAIGPASV